MIHLAFFASLGQGKKQLPALSTSALLSFQAPVQFSQILLIHFCPKLLFMRQTSLFSRFWFCPADPYTFFLIPVSDLYNTASPHISRADTLGPSLSVGPHPPFELQFHETDICVCLLSSKSSALGASHYVLATCRMLKTENE